MSTMRMLVLLAAAGVFTAVWASKKQELPEVTEDGLHRIHEGRMALVYADPGADLSYYNRIHLVEAYVAFRKNWERDQRTRSATGRLRSSDIEKIKTSLAEEFHAVFRDELEKGGYVLTDEAADDVMIVRPAIINLDVNAPDKPHAGMSQVYTASAGEMTLYIELIDSVTGDTFAKALDRRVDNARGGWYTWTNSVTNRAAAQRILRGWATILREALDEAHSQGS